jgi:hypothetical protein
MAIQQRHSNTAEVDEARLGISMPINLPIFAGVESSSEARKAVIGKLYFNQGFKNFSCSGVRPSIFPLEFSLWNFYI